MAHLEETRAGAEGVISLKPQSSRLANDVHWEVKFFQTVIKPTKLTWNTQPRFSEPPLTDTVVKF